MNGRAESDPWPRDLKVSAHLIGSCLGVTQSHADLFSSPAPISRWSAELPNSATQDSHCSKMPLQTTECSQLLTEAVSSHISCPDLFHVPTGGEKWTSKEKLTHAEVPHHSGLLLQLLHDSKDWFFSSLWLPLFIPGFEREGTKRYQTAKKFLTGAPCDVSATFMKQLAGEEVESLGEVKFSRNLQARSWSVCLWIDWRQCKGREGKWHLLSTHCVQVLYTY